MLRPSNVKYIVNKEKRTVTCIAIGTKADVCNYIGQYCADKGVVATNLCISDKFVGVAKCCAEDTWNELEGKKAAYSHVCWEYTCAVNKALGDTVARLRNLANIIEAKKIR